MKRLFNLIMLLVFTRIIYSQDLDHLMTKRYISCQDIEYNCSFLIPDYYKRGLIDSLNYTLKYWENRCGENNLLFQIKTLMNIKQSTLNDNDINRQWIDKLVNFRRTQLNNLPFSRYYWNYYSNYTNVSYIDFLDSLSAEFEKSSNHTTTEDYLIKLFLGKAKLYELGTKEYTNSKLSILYNEYVDSILRLPEFTLSIYSGVFVPTQSASILGNHGLIGFGFGGIFYKNSIDLLLDFKFGPPKENYLVLYNDSIIASDKYTGMYVGLEYGRTVYMKNNSEYFLTCGVGGERITAVYRDDDRDKEPKFLWSPNYSIGLGYRYRYNYKNSFSVQFRYHHLDFNNPSGTKLSGHGYTIRIIWIMSSNGMRSLLPML